MAETINKDAITAMSLVVRTIQEIAHISTIQRANKQLLSCSLKGARDEYDRLQKLENKGRASLVKQRTAIACFEEVINVLTECLEFLEAHDRKFRQGLKKSWEPLALQQYALENENIHREAVAKFNSRGRVALGLPVATRSGGGAVGRDGGDMSALAARIAALTNMVTAGKTTESV